MEFSPQSDLKEAQKFWASAERYVPHEYTPARLEFLLKNKRDFLYNKEGISLLESKGNRRNKIEFPKQVLGEKK